RVRSGPGSSFPTRVILRDDATVIVQRGPDHDELGAPWYQLADARGAEVWGWSAAAYVQPLDSCEVSPTTLARPAIQARVMTVQLTAYTFQEPIHGAHGVLTRSGSAASWGVVA